MATTLYLRNTTGNGIAGYYDLLITAGASADTGVVNTAAAGTDIQWTKTAGGTAIKWISGRVPAGGFTLTTGTMSLWGKESNAKANCGGRVHIYKYSAGVETELGGSPFSKGLEYTTSDREDTWATDVTDTAFAEDDRIVIKAYITNVGTMATGYTCTMTFNAADAATGDSFWQMNENVTFKADSALKDLITNDGFIPTLR